MIFKRADIMLPKFVGNSDDMTKWSVIACDQYTQDYDYWNNTKNEVGDNPSTLNIIVPEIYLNNSDIDERIKNVNYVMKNYVDNGIFNKYKNAFIYVERTQKNGAVRRGIVGCIDLEEYDYNKGSKTKIRATEGTVLERIPPRLKVRENAIIELPHIMMLIDDETKSIIEFNNDIKDSFELLYDFKLNNDSGHIKGYLMSDEACIELENKLDSLDNIDKFNKKYNCKENNPLIFAVGDGNHSLATAKSNYMNLKQQIGDKALVHPARYALCELVNLYDESLVFEPIHRVVFNSDFDLFINELSKMYDVTVNGNADGQKFTLIYKNEDFNITLNNTTQFLTVGSVQDFLDSFCKTYNCEVDYIHGEQDVRKLCNNSSNIGIILDVMSKTELYKSVIESGALPRKTFSMGEAYDKRFYVECREIK